MHVTFKWDTFVSDYFFSNYNHPIILLDTTLFASFDTIK
jgi:hypothetical protein